MCVSRILPASTVQARTAAALSAEPARALSFACPACCLAQTPLRLPSVMSAVPRTADAWPCCKTPASCVIVAFDSPTSVIVFGSTKICAQLIASDRRDAWPGDAGTRPASFPRRRESSVVRREGTGSPLSRGRRLPCVRLRAVATPAHAAGTARATLRPRYSTPRRVSHFSISIATNTSEGSSTHSASSPAVSGCVFRKCSAREHRSPSVAARHRAEPRQAAAGSTRGRS